MHRVDFRSLALGVAFMVGLFVAGVTLAGVFEPARGTARPTSSDWLFRTVPALSLIAGGWIATRRVSAPWQAVVAVMLNSMILAGAYFVADRISGDRVFDLAALLLAVPFFIVLGGAGVVISFSRVAAGRWDEASGTIPPNSRLQRTASRVLRPRDRRR